MAMFKEIIEATPNKGAVPSIANNSKVVENSDSNSDPNTVTIGSNVVNLSELAKKSVAKRANK